MNDLVVIKPVTVIPKDWDYDASVSKTKQLIYKWGNFTNELANELWIAKKRLAKEGKPVLTGTKVPVKTWTTYCEDIGHSRRVVNRWLERWFNPPELPAHVSYNSGENEWYTPKEYADAADKTMGGIHLDPASSDKANKIIKADKYYTKETNGLKHKWQGNVWMNPPYSQPLIKEFIDKLIDGINCEDIKQACVLVNNATETLWFQALLQRCSVVCFLKGRIKFIDKGGNGTGAPLQGQAILYFGNNDIEFYNNFNQFGIVLWTKKTKNG